MRRVRQQDWHVLGSEGMHPDALARQLLLWYGLEGSDDCMCVRPRQMFLQLAHEGWKRGPSIARGDLLSGNEYGVRIRLLLR